MSPALACNSLNSPSYAGRFGLTSTPITLAFGKRPCSSSSRLASSSEVSPPVPVMFPPGRLRLVTRPLLTGSAAIVKTIGMVLVAAFAASAETGPPPATRTSTGRRTSSAASADDRDRRCCCLGRPCCRSIGDNDGHLPPNEIGCQRGELIVSIVRKSVFDLRVPALDVLGLLQALPERGQQLWVLIGRSAAEKSDHRHRRLLRARRARPRRRAAEQRDERAPLHVWMAPAWQEKM